MPTAPVHHANTSNGRIAYTRRGQGPTALFVHGVFVNGHLWDDVVDRVCHMRQCICPDLLAHGQSRERSGADLSFAGHAAALAELLDALEVDQVDLVANDSGGGIAQILAARHPERIRSLTLTNCDTHDGWPPPAFLETHAQMAGDGGPALLRALSANPALVRTSFASALEFPERLDDDAIHRFIDPLVRDDDRISSLVEMFRAMNCQDTVEVEPQLRKLAAPALIVWGSADPFFDVHWAHWLRDALPNVRRLIDLPTGRLFLPLDRPDDLATELLLHWQPELRARLTAP
ncbi:MAG: alpha/beta hydrolase [Myxococcales bacterium]|nr:alpha/beta hydrolase [Myxococcales bacterium]